MKLPLIPHDTSNNKEYPSITKAAKLLNINESTLGSKLNGRLKNNTTLKFLEEYGVQ